MKKIYFIAVIVLILGIVFVNSLNQKSENIVEPDEPEYITVVFEGYCNKPGEFEVPANITKDKLIELASPKVNAIYRDFEIEDGVVIIFDKVVDNPIVIESATLEELDSLPKIGEAKAEKIINFLKEKKHFKDWDEFFDVVEIRNAEDQYNIKLKAILR